MFEIKILTDPKAILELAPEWDPLVRGTDGEVFSGPRWYEAHRRADDLRSIGLVTARLQGELVGLLPLCILRADWKGLFFSTITPMGRGDHQTVPIRKEHVASLLPQMIDCGLGHFKGVGTFWWPFIPEDDPSLPVLRDYFRARNIATFEASEKAPRLRIDNLSFEQLEKLWAKNHRIDVRRQRKRLAETGDYILWEPSSLQEAREVLEEFFDVHDEKWLAQGSPGLFRGEKRRRQFREILENLWGHGMYFTTIRQGDLNISYHFGIRAAGWIQWYRPSYRSQFHGYSPGKIHIALLLEEAIRNDWQGFDFLLGEEPYKLQWANESKTVYSIWAAVKPNALSYQWLTKGKPYFRATMSGYLARALVFLQRLRGGPGGNRNA